MHRHLPPTLVGLGDSEGFVVTYPEANAETLRELRLYQQTLRNSGWLSRIEYAHPGNGLRLYVFRPDDLPYAAFGVPNRYVSR